jgi:hypothetical protein
MRLRKHIYRTHALLCISSIKAKSSLCSRVATYINHFSRSNFHDLFNHVFVHSVTWWISDNTSGCPCCAIKSSLNTTFISPKNSQFGFHCVPHSLLHLIASGTLSTPLLFFAFFRNKLSNSSVPV